MKLTVPQLSTHLSKTLSPVYLLCGDEPFLVQEALAALRQKANTAGFNDRLRLDLENDADVSNLYHYAYTPSLLSGKRLIELHWKGGKLSKAGQKFLQEYAQQPSPHNLVVSCLGKLDSKTEQTQWFKTLEKNIIVISIWPLPPNQWPVWLQERARAHQFQLTPEAAQKLAYLTEGNLAAAAQEIEKLSLLNRVSIDANTVSDFVEDQGCFHAFDLVDQAVAGNAKEVLRILRHLQKEGAEPLMILGAITFELRTLVKLAKELNKGLSLNNLFAQYRIRLNKQAGIRTFFKRGSQTHLFELFHKAAELDRLAKGALQGDIWLAFEQLSLELAGVVPQHVPRDSRPIADPFGTIYN